MPVFGKDKSTSWCFCEEIIIYVAMDARPLYGHLIYICSCGCKTYGHLNLGCWCQLWASNLYVWHVDDDKLMQYICVLVEKNYRIRCHVCARTILLSWILYEIVNIWGLITAMTGDIFYVGLLNYTVGRESTGTIYIFCRFIVDRGNTYFLSVRTLFLTVQNRQETLFPVDA
jgi:hypothetical protein